MRIFTILLTVFLLVVSGCGGAPERERRLAASADLLSTYSDNVRRRIERGDLSKGMTREQVHLSFGVPDDIQRELSREESVERWLYKRPSGIELELFFVSGRLASVNPIVEEEPSGKVREARERVLSSFEDSNLSRDIKKTLTDGRGKRVGSLEGTLRYNPEGKEDIPLPRETVTLVPLTEKWGEVISKLEKEKALKKGLPRVATLRMALRQYQALLPDTAVLRAVSDDEGGFRFPSVPEGRWVAAVDLSSEYGFYLWLITVEIKVDEVTRMRLDDNKPAALYKID